MRPSSFPLAASLALTLLAGCAQAPARPDTSSSAPAAERITWVETPAARLRVSDGGTGGVPVVLLHGLASELEVWRSQLDHLRPSRRAVAYDQRGHGASGRASDGVYDVDALADDLERVRAALGLERMVLVGHSLSGTVLTTYAGRHPERVAGLVYVDAIGDFSALPPAGLEAMAARERSAHLGTAEVQAEFGKMLEPARPETREQVLASVTRFDPGAFGLLRASMFTFRGARERLGTYRGPAIAVEDAAGPYPAVMAAKVLGFPRTQVADVSHWLQLDDPAALNRALDAFLASLPPT